MSSPRPTSKRQRVKNFFESNPFASSSRARPHESVSSDSSQQSHVSENLKISGRFALLIVPKLAGCVDGNPAKMAFNILNVIMDVKKEINDNKDELQKVLEETLMLLSTVLVTMETGSNAHSIVDQTVTQYKREITQQLERITTLNDRLTTSLITQFDYKNYNEQLMDISRKIGGSTNRFNTGMAGNAGIMVDELRDEKREEKLRKDLNPSKVADHRFIHDGKGALMRKTCTEGTRVKILQEITEWANDFTKGSPSVFWLTGQAGAGKTTIAYTIAKRFGSGQPTTLGASFFCSRQFAETQSLRRIVPTIAFQLARQCEPYRIALFGVDTSDAVDSHNVDEQIQKFLFKPWLAQARGHGPLTYLIVVDALDEIENVDRSSFLKNLLESVENVNISGLKFLVTSRPDRDITMLCKSFPPGAICQLQNVPVEQAKQDVKTYLTAELTDLNGTPELDQLNEKAAGLFIYAATVVKILTKNELDKDEQLLLLRRLLSSTSSSLSSIDQLYQQIMRDAFEDLDDDLLRNRLRILYTFLCSAERISASVASSLVDTKVGIASKVLDSLHSVLYVEDGRVYWYHASFPDFIFNCARSNFRMDDKDFTFSCDAAVQHSLLTHACFRIMNSEQIGLRFNMGDIKSSYPLDSEHAEELRENVDKNITPALRYACMHWAHHVSLSPTSKDNSICDVITDFLQLRALFWIEALHLLGSSAECSYLLNKARHWVSTDGNTSLAKDLLAVADFASYFTSSPATESTPHLYISSLATWQSASHFSRSWKEAFPHIPVYKHTGGIVAMPIMTTHFKNLLDFIAFSPNGKHVVAVSRQSVVVLDASTGRAEYVLHVDHYTDVTHIKFSPDGSRFVMVANTSQNYYMVHIWDASTFKLLHEFKAQKAAISTEGTQIFTISEADSDGHCQFQVLDISAGTLLRKGHFRTTEFNDKYPLLLGFSSLSMRFMIVLEESVEIWDILLERAPKKITLNDCIVYKTWGERGTISPGGKLVAMVTSEDGFEVGVFDASTGSRLFVLPHDQRVFAFDFSYEGTHIGSISVKGSLCIWDAATGAKLKVLNTNEGPWCNRTSVAFTRDGSHIGLSLENTIQVWSLDDLAEPKGDTQNNGLSNNIFPGLRYVGVSDNSPKKIMSFSENTVQIWDATTGTTLMAWWAPSGFYDVQMSGNGKNIVCHLRDGSVKIFDAMTWNEIMHLESEVDTTIYSIAISRSGQKIALIRRCIVWEEGCVEICQSVENGKEAEFVVQTLLRVNFSHNKQGFLNPYECSLAFSDDERYIVVAFQDNSKVIYDLQAGNTHKIESGIVEYGNRSLFVYGNKFAMICHEESELKRKDCITCEVWDIPSCKHQHTFELSLWPRNHDRTEGNIGACSFGFSSNGEKFITAWSDGYIRIWSAISNKTVVSDVRLLYCSSDIQSIAVSRDDKLVVAGSDDGSVEVWDLDDGPDMAEKYPWASHSSGWITSSQNINHRLIWVSHALKVRQPRSISFISGPGYGSVDFSGATLGEDWGKCYSPQNHIGKSRENI